jgi:hypothetical protein
MYTAESCKNDTGKIRLSPEIPRTYAAVHRYRDSFSGGLRRRNADVRSGLCLWESHGHDACQGPLPNTPREVHCLACTSTSASSRHRVGLDCLTAAPHGPIGSIKPNRPCRPKLLDANTVPVRASSICAQPSTVAVMPGSESPKAIKQPLTVIAIGLYYVDPVLN